jgi:hypothetical protein
MNRYRNPLNWAISQIDVMRVEIDNMRREIKRLDREKAGKRGPKNRSK